MRPICTNITISHQPARNGGAFIVQDRLGGSEMRTRVIAYALLAGLVCQSVSATTLPGTPQGGEFQVDPTSAGRQNAPSVAMLPNGAFVTVWVAPETISPLRYDVFARRYDSAGAALGGPIRVPTMVNQAEGLPQVAAWPNGDFIVVYVCHDGSSGGVCMQRFFADGTKNGVETYVSLVTSGHSNAPKVATLPSGDALVAWSQYNSNWDAEARRVYADGSMGPVMTVNTVTSGNQLDPGVACSPNGACAISFSGLAIGKYGYIGVQRYDASGAAAGANFTANTYVQSGNGPRNSDIAMDAAGNITVVWEKPADGSGWGVRQRRFDSAGVALAASDSVVNTVVITDDQEIPRIAMSASGDYMVVWEDESNDGSGTGIYGARFDSSGAIVASDFRINTYTANNQATPGIAMDADGDAIVIWSSMLQDGADDGVFAQRYGGYGSIDIGIALSATPDPVAYGAPLALSATVTNLTAGSSTTGVPAIDQYIGLAGLLNVSFPLPAATTYLSAGGAGWICAAPSAGTVSCDRPTLAAGSSSSVALLVTAPTSYGTVVANASTSTASYETALANNAASASALAADFTPDPYPLASISGATPGTLQTSGAVTLSGFDTPVAISIAGGGEYRIYSVGVWGAWGAAPSTITPGDAVQVRAVSSAISLGSVSPTLVAGGVSSTFTVTTGDLSPDPFSFSDETDAAPSTWVGSDVVATSGFDVDVAIAASGGEYRIQTGAGWSSWTSAAGTIAPGSSVQIRVFSSSLDLTPASVNLTIGTAPYEQAATFTATTGGVAPP